MDGVLNINKPAGMTSHDVVALLRRILHEKKVGHTGTLDPDATGVLPVCLGKATKIIQFLQDDEKCYEGTITLGIETDTLDAGGRILGISHNMRVEPDDIKRVFNSFIGEIDQIPPMVSAIKIQGERLYNIARQGKTIERTPRKVRIYDLELLKIYEESVENVDPSSLFTRIDFRVRCSRGTYVRVLAADIGKALGCGAHLAMLVRTKSGAFKLEDSIRLDEIQAEPENTLRALQPVDDVLSFMPAITITDSARKRFLNGVSVEGSEVVRYENKIQVNDLIRVHDGTGTLLGIGRFIQINSSKTVICKAIRILN